MISLGNQHPASRNILDHGLDEEVTPATTFD